MKALFLFFFSLSLPGLSFLWSPDFWEDISASLLPPAEVSMLSFGDLMLGRDIARLMEEEGDAYPFEKIFGPDGLDPHAYDLLSANLEGPIVEAKKRTDLFPQFAFNPETIPSLLKEYSFDLLSLANNHSWDHNVKGWESTLVSLGDVNIAHVGHPKNWFDYDLYETELNGLRLGFIAITDMLFPVDWDEAKAKVAELQEKNDFVVLMIHWGIEFQTVSSQNQRDRAHEMIDAGVDLIIGHHPHVVQEHEYYKGKPIYYSLGNFVFDQYFSDAANQGLALDITFQENGEIFIEEIPFEIVKGQPQLVRESEKNVPT